MGGNCPGRNCPRRWVGIVRVGIVRWELSGWELSVIDMLTPTTTVEIPSARRSVARASLVKDFGKGTRFGGRPPLSDAPGRWLSNSVHARSSLLFTRLCFCPCSAGTSAMR